VNIVGNSRDKGSIDLLPRDVKEHHSSKDRRESLSSQSHGLIQSVGIDISSLAIVVGVGKSRSTGGRSSEEEEGVAAESPVAPETQSIQALGKVVAKDVASVASVESVVVELDPDKVELGVAQGSSGDGGRIGTQ